MTPRPSRLPELVTGERLTLRRWRNADCDDLARAITTNLEHLRPWMPWIAEEPLERPARLALLAVWKRDWRAGGDVVFGAFAGNKVVGGCGLHRRRGPEGLDIGYWVDQDHLRRGVATEIGRLLTTAAFTVPGIGFTEIHHDKANLASGRVPRRLGYRFLGESPTQPEAPGECGIDCGWRMEKADWPMRAS